MNRNEHLIWSEFILIVGMGALLIVLLNEHTLWPVSIAFITGVGAFLLGCVMPDFDHKKVQQKMFLLRPLKNITKHRGHWHSLCAMCVYGLILFLVFFWIINYWFIPLGAGMFGFFTHLLLDDIKNIKTNGKRTIKIF